MGSRRDRATQRRGAWEKRRACHVSALECLRWRAASTNISSACAASSSVQISGAMIVSVAAGKSVFQVWNFSTHHTLAGTGLDNLPNTVIIAREVDFNLNVRVTAVFEA